MNKLSLGNEELICSWGNDLWSGGTEMKLSCLVQRPSMEVFSSAVLWCSKWYPCTLVSLFVKALLWFIMAWTQGTWDKSEQQAAAIKRMFTNLVC